MVKGRYNGFGIKGLFPMLKMGYVQINWRSKGSMNKIGIHIADKPPENIKGKLGEDYIIDIIPPGSDWTTTTISMKNFKKNIWWQPPNVYDDGIFDFKRAGMVDIGFEDVPGVKIEIKDIRLTWVNPIIFYMIIIGIYISIGFLLLFRTSSKILSFSDELGQISYSIYIRISFLLTAINLGVCIVSSNGMFFDKNYLLFIGILFGIMFIEDIVPHRLLKYRMLNFRYLFLYLIISYFITSINLISYGLILILIFLPVLYLKDKPTFFIITAFLIGNILLNPIFKGDLLIFFLITTLTIGFFIYLGIDRTFLRNNRENLESAIALYNGIYLHSSEVIYTTSLDGTISSINRAFENILGLKAKEVIGRNIKDFIADEDHGKLGFKITGEKPEVRRFDANIGKNRETYHTAYFCENPISLGTKLTGYQVIATDITERIKMEKALEALVNIDGLTGVSNRRYFDKQLDIEIRRCFRTESSLCLIFIDVDFFKLYNDYYGHTAGDLCLQKVSNVLKGTLKRAADLVSRYGGEEFVILLPETDIEAASKIAQLIKDTLEAVKISHQDSKVSPYVTISMGISSIVPGRDTLNENSGKLLTEQADKALYVSKETGRNKFSIYSEEK